jgi:hypothetical protein
VSRTPPCLGTGTSWPGTREPPAHEDREYRADPGIDINAAVSRPVARTQRESRCDRHVATQESAETVNFDRRLRFVETADRRRDIQRKDAMKRFVGNLPANMSARDLRDLLTLYANVVLARADSEARQ